MAKFVVAGKSDCPLYAKAELLADELKLRLPDIEVHKIVVNPDKWNSWMKKTCFENGWDCEEGTSPIIWRELINRGGKGLFLGSCDEFFEMSKNYYGVTCDKIDDELLKEIALENKQTKLNEDMLEKEMGLSCCSYRISLVVNKSSLQYVYHFLPHICSEKVLTTIDEIELLLCCSPNGMLESDFERYDALIMEMQDCAHKKLKSVEMCFDFDVAFVNSDFVIIFTDHQQPGKENADSVAYAKMLGESLNLTKKHNPKIIVAGESCMQFCYLIKKYADKLSLDCFYALSRCHENKIKSAMAKKLKVNTANMGDIILWGADKNFVIDSSNAIVYNYNGAIWSPFAENFAYSAQEIIYDKEWLKNDLPQSLNPSDISVKKDVMLLSTALLSQIRDLLLCERNGIFSLGVVSQGEYGIPEGLVFSMPVIYCNGEIQVKTDLELSSEMLTEIQCCAKDFEGNCEIHLNRSM